jgi:hypothetical protein
MIERLLKAKHWQLFLLLFGLPFVFYIGWMISFVSRIMDSSMDNFSSDYPIEMFRKDAITPCKVFTKLRQAHKRIKFVSGKWSFKSRIPL